MILNTLADEDILYYRRHLFETADKIGTESVCFVLDAWEKEVSRLYKKYKALFRLCRLYGNNRFEKAAERANFYGRQDAAILSFILKNSLDSLPLDCRTDLSGQRKLNFD